jgi:hypothetical protein
MADLTRIVATPPFRKQGDYAAAEPLFKAALDTREKNIPTNHIDIGQTLQGYSRICKATGRKAEAEEMRARADSICSKYKQNADK